MSKNLENMTVAELEAESYRLTQARLEIRKEAVAVQAMLSQRIDEQRISQLLGREVQLVNVPGIENKDAGVSGIGNVAKG